MEVEQRAAAFAQGGHFRALEVDRAVERHQQLNGLQLPILCGKLQVLVHVFIR